jgi:hypothetical protein
MPFSSSSPSSKPQPRSTEKYGSGLFFQLMLTFDQLMIHEMARRGEPGVVKAFLDACGNELLSIRTGEGVSGPPHFSYLLC